MEYEKLLATLREDETGILYHRSGDTLYAFAFDERGIETLASVLGKA